MNFVETYGELRAHPSLVEQQRERLVEHLEKMGFENNEFVVTGGAAMVFHGLRLKNHREGGDKIEVFVSPEYFTKATQKGEASPMECMPVGCYCIDIAEHSANSHANPQIFTLINTSEAHLASLRFPAILSNTEQINNVPVINLEILQQWKKAQSRPIDRLDVKLINFHLAPNRLGRFVCKTELSFSEWRSSK